MKQNQICFQLENRIKPINLKTEPIVKTKLLYGKENIPLCNHRGNSRHYDIENWNFLTLWNFRLHCKTTLKNATYCSKTTQREFIECCSEFKMRES